MRKKILIVTENLGKTAPGIVFERLASELSSRHDADIICLNNKSLIPECELNLIYAADSWLSKALLSSRIKKRISKISLILFKDDWAARLNALFLKNSFRYRENHKYDLCISMISFGHTSPLIFAEYLKKLMPKTINAAYFVDAIPAPIGWSISNKEYHGLKHYISKRMEKLDAIFSSNDQMLDYQISVTERKIPDLRGVILNPTSGKKQILPPPPKNRFNFLYTGGIYGKRTPKHILNAFKIVLKKHPKSYLVFVGTTFQEEDFSMLTNEERAQVEVHPFTQDLTQFYAEATALLDIDAELDGDVFLSSKVTNYLTIDRIIISETGKNSPARILLSNTQSIFQCNHDCQEIAQNMCKAIEKTSLIDYADRLHLIKIFSPDYIIDKLELDLGLT